MSVETNRQWMIFIRLRANVGWHKRSRERHAYRQHSRFFTRELICSDHAQPRGSILVWRSRLCQLQPKVSGRKEWDPGHPHLLHAIAGRFFPNHWQLNACAICSTLKSSWRPTICTPTGSPSGVNPRHRAADSRNRDHTSTTSSNRYNSDSHPRSPSETACSHRWLIGDVGNTKYSYFSGT
jgi:hypothetical protein